MVLVSVISGTNAQTRNVRAEAMQLKKVMLEKHVAPPLIDDQFSGRVFNLVLDQLDPDGYFFTMEEITTLQVHREKIDDELNGRAWNFFPTLVEHYRRALIRSQEFIAVGTEAPFNVLSKVQPIDTSRARSEFDHKSLWRLLLHYQVMEELAELRRSFPSLSDKDFLAKHEPIVRQKEKLRGERLVKRILYHSEGFESHLATTFLQCISMAFDPHSTYMSTTQMENFISRLSTEGYYFGLGLDENESGDLVIANIKPGSPAWKSGVIHNGDVIEKMRWKGNGNDWIDVAGMDESEVDEILNESNHNALELTLRNLTNGQVVVELKKEKLNSDENVVRSFILEGDRKIGYIYLPDFYSEWGEVEGAKCASDVAKEIIKLKAENVEGLILDVRYNGGGSLSEAVAMAGSFIDAGPMGILGDRGKEPVTEKDYNRGTVWDGPLVIMVNKLSASASEFLAAALQDYRRAIIVGSVTYGKATGQEMFSMTPGKSTIDFTNLASNGGWGFSTITTSRIYRITGKSLQNVGVVPDVRLPDLFELVDYHESLMPYSIKQDSISKKTYYTPLAPLPLDCIRDRSAFRLKSDTAFSHLRTYIETFKRYQPSEASEWNMLLKESMEKHHVFQNFSRALDATKPDFGVIVTGEKENGATWDEYQRSVNSAWVKNITKDISLAEGFHIICDYIELTNSK
jgi:carboxyl-terminal processing protease